MAAVLNSPYTNTFASTRPRHNSQDYPTDTIGHQAGASLLKHLGKGPRPPNGNLAASSDRRPGSAPVHQVQPRPLSPAAAAALNRFPPGTMESQDSDLDPMERMPSLEYLQQHEDMGQGDHEEELTDEGASDQLQGQWMPVPPQQQQQQQHHNGQRTQHGYTLSDSQPPEVMAREEDERRARQYATMSAAEQYAMQAKIHNQGYQHPDAGRDRHMSSPSPRDEDSLGSPFHGNQPFGSTGPTSNSHAGHRGLHHSRSNAQGGSRSTSRTEKGSTSRRPHDRHGNHPPTRGTPQKGPGHRGSTASLGISADPSATGSGMLSKDELLERMADALRKERLKNKSYMKELQESELEIDALSRMLDQTRNEAAETNSRQLATMAALRRDLDRTRQLLEDAREVGADDAERFLGLLDSVQFGSVKDKEAAARQFGRPTSEAGFVDFTSEAGDDFGASASSRHPIPHSKAEAILTLAADEPGGVSTKARQRAADRHHRLDAALSTIASSTYAGGGDKQKPRQSIPFPIPPEDQMGSTTEEQQTTLEMDIDEEKKPSRLGNFFRRRKDTAESKSDMPDSGGLHERIRVGSSRLRKPLRRASDPSVSAASVSRRDQGIPRASMDDPNSGPGGGLVPPLISRAHEGGTWGRSASSDVRRSQERLVFDDPSLPFGNSSKKKDKSSRPPTGPRPAGGKRRGSFTKIMGKLFPPMGEEAAQRKEAEKEGF